MSRPIRDIAREIQQDWKQVYFGARPYLNAMYALNTVDDAYCADDGRTIVLYFLANAAAWRGDTARRIKAELKAMVK